MGGKPNYLSLSVHTFSIWIIIIVSTYITVITTSITSSIAFSITIVSYNSVYTSDPWVLVL